MTIQDIATLFRQYIDEPNKTFITDTDVKVYLKQGFDQFREIATQADPKTFTEELAAFVLSGERQIDLSSSPITPNTPAQLSILGSAAFTNYRGMIRFTDMVQVDSFATNNITSVLRGAGSYNDLYVPDLLASPGYYLTGTKLLFSQPVAGNFKIMGIKQQDPALWANLNSTAYPSDLIPYHDLIALLAYRNYAIRDGALSQPAEAQLAKRTDEFKEYIQFGREMRGSNRVLVENVELFFY